MATGTFGFISPENVKGTRSMFNAMGMPYREFRFARGFKFNKPLKAADKAELLSYLNIEKWPPGNSAKGPSDVRYWPTSDEEGFKDKVNKSAPTYFDLISNDEDNVNTIREFLISKGIHPGVPEMHAIFLFEPDFNKMNIGFIRHACELIAESPRGNYSAGIKKAIQANTSGQTPKFVDENGNQMSQSDSLVSTVMAIREALRKHLDLSKENYPPPVMSVQGMGLRTFDSKQGTARSIARQLLPFGRGRFRLS